MTSLALRSLWISCLFFILLINFFIFSGTLQTFSGSDIGDYQNTYFGFHGIYNYFVNNNAGKLLTQYNTFVNQIKTSIADLDLKQITQLSKVSITFYNLLLGVATILIILVKGLFLAILVLGYAIMAIIWLLVAIYDFAMYLTPMPEGFLTL